MENGNYNHKSMRRKVEKALYDLQIVYLWLSKNKRSLAEVSNLLPKYPVRDIYNIGSRKSHVCQCGWCPAPETRSLPAMGSTSPLKLPVLLTPKGMRRALPCLVVSYPRSIAYSIHPKPSFYQLNARSHAESVALSNELRRGAGCLVGKKIL